MHERELRAFVAIVEAGRMDYAATSLGYSQPAISYQIKCLEQQLGARLFFRHPDGAQLTPEGAMVLPSARAVLALLDGIKEVTGRQNRPATLEKLRVAG
ncbi:LysR family transcriptional regulator [Micromonospora sp. NPDC005220]|uniref:LysR family transcriptional regulator n=1 Tax=Micromonospora sp. NPDC005220 TaxID=3155589 RepID=UPI0033AAA01E